MNDIHEMIIGMSYPYFGKKKVTQEEINGFIEAMEKTFPKANLDRALLFRELEAINSVSIGEMKSLDDSTDHKEWFNPSTGEGLRRPVSWHFWDHYCQYLSIRKKWPRNLVMSIDSQSNQILSRLEDPQREGCWDRRGMVMGSVQSGKTANYTALITKAADAGYKFIVVLAGVHDSLRSQTQTRLNEEFLGYDLDRVQKLTGVEKRIGVRAMFPNHATVYTLTSSNQKGDFKKTVASQSGIFPSKNGPPIVLIIKKNVSILKNLNSWVPSVIGQSDAHGRRIIRDIPLLVIDDECDYASINTKEPERDENGAIIEEWDPTKTNLLIRQLLNIFEKKAYVGYTATPYANIFIHSDDPHPKYGEDLFPRSFIISLPQPDNYLGPERVFGLDGDRNRDIQAIEPLPLVRFVNDNCDLIPDGHNKDLKVEEIPPSLKRAIKCFLLSCAVRRLRATGTPHNSMLVHVTRFTAVQKQVKLVVERELSLLVARVMSRDDLADLREIWEQDFMPTTTEMAILGFREAVAPAWQDVERSLGIIARVVKVKEINGTVRDILDYKIAEMDAEQRARAGEEVPWEERGLNVIAIGGDKLSRGLTLEGLSVSYYLRASTLYDTLMQMGRWFGFRDGYSDMCRIFTTDELASFYSHIALATIELRGAVNYMSELGLTPKEFGLKIRDHPGRLAVTSLGKSRNKQKVPLSYSGQRPMTVVFDPRQSQNNLIALEKLVQDLGHDPQIEGEDRRYHWRDVPSTAMLKFLSTYRTHEQAKIVVDPKAIARYIEKQNIHNELISWDVVLVSKEESRSTKFTDDLMHRVSVGDYGVYTVKRKALKVGDDRVSIGTLVNPSDETIDLTADERIAAIQYDRTKRRKEVADDGLPSGEAIRHARPKERGLLLIYLPSGRERSLADDSAGRPYGVKGEEIVAFVVSFPESSTAEPIDYWVNTVYQNEDVHYN